VPALKITIAPVERREDLQSAVLLVGTD
jgi:hypothetical protein